MLRLAINGLSRAVQRALRLNRPGFVSVSGDSPIHLYSSQDSLIELAKPDLRTTGNRSIGTWAFCGSNAVIDSVYNSQSLGGTVTGKKYSAFLNGVISTNVGSDTDVAQHGAREFGKEALDEVEPGAVLGREDKFKAVRGRIGEPSLGLLRDVCGMIIEDQLDRGSGRIGGVEKLEELNEFAAAVAILDQRVNPAGDKIDPSQQTDCPWRLYSCSRAKVACTPGSGGRSGAVVAIAWMPGFSS